MVFFVRVQILGRIVLSSTLALPFHIALVFLRVSATLLQGAYSHTEKHMRGQRMRQKIASRVSSVFASSSRQGAGVERACAPVYMYAGKVRVQCQCQRTIKSSSGRFRARQARG